LNDAVLPSLVRRAKRRALEQGEEVEQHREFVARIIFYEEEISLENSFPTTTNHNIVQAK
jgi:hypothetical protein